MNKQIMHWKKYGDKLKQWDIIIKIERKKSQLPT